jgi:hypothetical protein
MPKEKGDKRDKTNRKNMEAIWKKRNLFTKTAPFSFSFSFGKTKKRM